MEKKIIEISNPTKFFGPLESFNTLRTNLLYNQDLKVIALTSTSPDEGKTVVAFHLAKSFVDLNKRVVLVDCDLRRSSLKDFLHLEKSEVGLSEVLTNQADDFIMKTNIHNFYIAFSGKRPPNPSELIHGKNFDNILEYLRANFDYVIIDTPPTNAASDATIIGQKSDGVVLVVRNEYTKKKAVKRAKVELERNGVRIVGAVLNRVKKNQLDYSGYYKYDKYYY